jgi:flavin reductase (DIM6/NTAB) family NADH-FMN oxidoreductase RutF
MKFKPAALDKTALHELFASAITPRPIAFISTVGADGVFNLAPFSFFAPLCLRPAVLAFSIGWGREGRKKDTLKNIEDTRDFVFNVVTEELAEAMNKSACEYPGNVDEFKETGLTPVKAEIVKAPLLAESPVNMECRVLQILKFGEGHSGNTVVIGEVLLAHVRDEFWAVDQIDAGKLKAIGRLGGDLYCRTRDIFEMQRPWWDPEAFKKEG